MMRFYLNQRLASFPKIVQIGRFWVQHKEGSSICVVRLCFFFLMEAPVSNHRLVMMQKYKHTVVQQGMLNTRN